MIRTFNHVLHAGMDAAMCALMNLSQWRLRRHAVTRERLERYLAECQTLDAAQYYATQEENRTLPTPEWHLEGSRLTWNSPLRDEYPENHKAMAIYFKSDIPGDRPTLVLLHALMSASDFGYRRIAARFTAQGWNVLFPHLPYHYSRTPRGYATGALTITSDLVRNAETLRQSVIELRQLLGWARANGSPRTALLGTSYGGWVAALAMGFETVDFAVLLQPVADVPHATFRSPASSMMSGLLKKNGIHPEDLERHGHLSSPARRPPLASSGRITVIGGTHDRLSPPESLRSLCVSWGGARYLEVNQGHFGYRAMRCALEETDRYK
jgi:pimeloyl-ACP methyl ester carboxylesterase